MTIDGVGIFGVVGFICVVPVKVTFWCSYCSQPLWKPSFAGFEPIFS